VQMPGGTPRECASPIGPERFSMVAIAVDSDGGDVGVAPQQAAVLRRLPNFDNR